jgi:hypothetical protein
MNPIPRTITIILVSLVTITCATAYAYVNPNNRLLVSDPEPQKIDLIFTAAGVGQRNDRSIDPGNMPQGTLRAIIRQAGIIEKYGSGIRRIRSAMLDAGNPKPDKPLFRFPVLFKLYFINRRCE